MDATEQELKRIEVRREKDGYWGYIDGKRSFLTQSKNYTLKVCLEILRDKD